MKRRFPRLVKLEQAHTVEEHVPRCYVHWLGDEPPAGLRDIDLMIVLAHKSPSPEQWVEDCKQRILAGRPEMEERHDDGDDGNSDT